MKLMTLGATSVLLCLVLLGGCQTMKKSNNFATIGLDFAWSSADKCSSESPAFELSDVPEGTKTLIFKMTDLDVRSYNHGGGKVPYTGNNHIPAGAFHYKGPCPPNGVHDYEIKVKAVDESGSVLLGEGVVVRAFPPSK